MKTVTQSLFRTKNLKRHCRSYAQREIELFLMKFDSFISIFKTEDSKHWMVSSHIVTEMKIIVYSQKCIKRYW